MFCKRDNVNLFGALDFALGKAGGDMTFDELTAAAHDKEGFSRFFSCYRAAQAGAVPASQEALPMRQLAKIMTHVTLLEWVAPDQITYRIAGDAIIERLGFNPTGTNFLDLLHADQRTTSIEGHQTMMAHPCGCYLLYENEFENGSRAVLETITLPMRKTADAEAKFFFSFHAHHSTTGVAEDITDTALVVNWRRVEHADIGCGVPAGKALLPSSVSEAATT